MDDLFLAVGVPCYTPWRLALSTLNSVLDFVQRDTYEDNLGDDRNLEIIPNDDCTELLLNLNARNDYPSSTSIKFLDFNIQCYNNLRSIKTTYHNKNHDIFDTKMQNVARLHHIDAPSTLNQKTLAHATLLVRAFDSCTFKHDAIHSAIALLDEAAILDLPPTALLSIIQRAHRARPHPIWSCIHTACHMLLHA